MIRAYGFCDTAPCRFC